MKSAMTYSRIAACTSSPLGRTARPRLRASALAAARKAGLSRWEAEGGALEGNARENAMNDTEPKGSLLARR